MPALDVLNALPDDWRKELDEAILNAQKVAQKLPLVRVAIPSKDLTRQLEEINDVLIQGVLRRSHKSDRSRDIEKRLGVTDGLYFGCRSHIDLI